MKTASDRASVLTARAGSDQAGFESNSRAFLPPMSPSRKSEAASRPRAAAKIAPVAAMRQGKPALLTIINASRLASAVARQGPSGESAPARHVIQAQRSSQ